MSQDKYARVLSCQMEAIVFIIYPSNSFATHALLKFGEYSNIPQFRSRDMFRPIACEQKYLMNYN